jgi:hypothetical protein
MPKCRAANGLAGDNLVCVDFSSVPDQVLVSPPPAQLAGWDFEKADKGCWQIASGKLQVKDFGNFKSTCGFLMPAVGASDFQKYSGFMLSVVHTVDVNATKQITNIYLGLPIAAQQIWFTTGTYPRQRNVFEIAKAAVPNGGSGTYQPLFQLVSSNTVGDAYTGWQIESIAINGVP